MTLVVCIISYICIYVVDLILNMFELYNDSLQLLLFTVETELSAN